MALEVHVLDYGDIELESSILVLGHDCGKTRRIPVYGYLILGGSYPIVVDTGYRDNATMEKIGMRGFQTPKNRMEIQLANHGVKIGDVRYVVHTHLHVDHAGMDDVFPLTTTVVVNRREMEFSVSGLMHPQYTKPVVQHMVDRIFANNAVRFLDLELTGREEIIPGVWCEAANAHTEGSANVIVETEHGLACICGDIMYDAMTQVVHDPWRIHDLEPRVTGNHSGSIRNEKAAIKKALNNYRFLLPSHTPPALVLNQCLTGFLGMTVPGPVVHKVEVPQWHPLSLN